MSATTDDIGSPPAIPEKQAIKFIACANNAHAECVRESATQRCSCLCHEAAAEIEAGDDFDPVEPSSVDEILDATAAEVVDGTIHTTVDGTEAVIKPPPEQPPLVNVSLEDLAHDLVVIDRKIKNEESNLAEVKKYIKDLNETREGILAEIKRKDDRGEQMGLGVE